ncbi:glycosyltransferase family protein [Roseiflexus castenholzii]|uniref:Glycosyltransferase RgtA/B/C/D-like domain-containing protein n=1 Tax=Roseiflexus castenholzii (strain DSM 13941 / HLO8) TaxID=383372 RepID=A7NRH5_ROSCS|nr:hypothetical protein [Roseiflexus castenholzii]ABU60171.1 conserved hypothetical protein [Roseiflexus castenholzii DSM 13941]
MAGIAGMRAWAQTAARMQSGDWVVLALLVCGALAMMYPVLAAPSSRIIGWPGDNIQYVYAAGWMAEALRSGASPFVDPRINAPHGLALTATDVPYVGYIAVAPLTWLFGPVFGYNAQLALAHLLSGVCAYLWVRHLTGSRIGGLTAGLAFMLAPFRLAHSYGHPQIVSTYPLPLFFWALDSSLRSQPDRKTLAGLVGATFLLGAASQYYLVIGLICGMVYALLTLATRRVSLLSRVWLAVPAVFVGALLAAAPYLMTARDGIYTPYHLDVARMWSASPMNFVAPSHLHPLWGTYVERLRPETLWGEKTLYVGIVPGILALAALRAFDRRWVWIGTALVAAVLSLGTDLHIGNVPLHRDHPVWLPAYYLHQLPGINLMRVWARFGIVTILFVALLAGIGAARLVHRKSVAGRLTNGFGGAARLRISSAALLSGAIVALIVVDLMPGRMNEYTTLAPRPIDHWLARQPGDFTVGFVPVIDATTNYFILFGTLTHGKRTIAFMHQAHLPPIFQDFNERSRGFPDSASAQRLRELGIRYLLLEKPMFDGARAFRWSVVEQRLAETPELRIVREVGDVVVVEFR